LPLFGLETTTKLPSLDLKQFAAETEKLESSRLADLRDKERRPHSGIIDDSCLRVSVSLAFRYFTHAVSKE